MYSRAEASQLRQSFWTLFGQYMAPQLSAEGARVNWINYKTGEKYVRFKLDTTFKQAYIALELLHPDPEIQQLYFEQAALFKNQLHQLGPEPWNWQLHARTEEELIVSRVFAQLQNVDVLKREDWPALISFFKPRLIALDAFWNDVKYAFEILR